MAVKENSIMRECMINLNAVFYCADYVHCSTDWKQKDYLSPNSAIGFIMAGEGWFMLEDNRFEPKPGQMYLLPEGYRHSFSTTDESNTFKKYYCHFRISPGAMNLFNMLKVPPCVTPKDSKKIEQLFKELIRTSRDSDHGILALKVKTILYELLYSYLGSCEDGSIMILQCEKDSDILLVPKYLEETLHKRLSIDEIANNFGYSSNHFTKLFKRCFMLTPLQYINKMRMSKSRLMISTTQIPISQISDMLGFENQYYFSNTFKKEFGIAPMEYRKMIIK